jgi:hypothetical protein
MNLNQVREIDVYTSFGVYTVVGIITRCFMTLPCGSAFESIHVFTSQFAVIFIFIGIGWGLYAFILPRGERPRVGQGIVTGLGVGFSGTTAIFLLFPPCG